jgi:flagellar FliL protein
MFVVKDMIVNPAGTNGSRFLLVTIGFESSSAEGVKELERKEIQLRDILNTVLTAKSLDELASVGQREELRTEIQARSGELVKVGSVTNVYFSKFIIQ